MVALLLSAALFVTVSGRASADPISNPDPADYGSALGGTGTFHPASATLNLEVIDFGEVFGLGGSEFGFFFQGTDASVAANRIAIFETSDQDPDPGGVGSVPQLAVVDFANGNVIDLDDGPSLQGTFTTSVSDIGFYIQLSATLANYYGTDLIYTVPGLNAGSVDHVSTFQALTDPNQYLLAFGAVDPTTGTFSPVAFEQVNFVTPSAVPEPATGLLCLFGVGTLVAARRRRRRGLVEPR